MSTSKNTDLASLRLAIHTDFCPYLSVFKYISYSSQKGFILAYLSNIGGKLRLFLLGIYRFLHQPDDPLIIISLSLSS